MTMTVASEARTAKRQHTAPCHDCPWARKSIKGWLGAHTVREWLSIAHSDQVIHCHTRKREDDEHWQCAGSSIYRANVCKTSRDAAVLQLPPNTVLVFSWHEFEAHHSEGIR